MASYVEARDDNLYVGKSRVTLQTLVEAWRSGRTPEQLQASFPSLPLVAVYGALTYFLEHREDAEAFFRETDVLDAQRAAVDEAANQDFYAEMRDRFERVRTRLGLEIQAS